MIDLIEKSTKNIKILGWQINDRDIFNALSKKSLEGIKVVVLADDYYLWTDSSIINDLLYLQKNNKNIEVVSDSYNNLLFYLGVWENDPSLNFDFNSFLHHHTLIIDDSIVVTGTNNWGLNGFILMTNLFWSQMLIGLSNPIMNILIFFIKK
jgi:phosphatidylserine/phosphatidylglycerophosphate/cardiolipin synthase-like enzyme